MSVEGIISRLRESRVVESIEKKPGIIFSNAGYNWEILEIKGEYVILYSKDRRYTPYVVAWKLDTSDGTWSQGHYFQTYKEAQEYLYSKEEGIEESENTIEEFILKELDPRLSDALMKVTGSGLDDSSYDYSNGILRGQGIVYTKKNIKTVGKSIIREMERVLEELGYSDLKIYDLETVEQEAGVPSYRIKFRAYREDIESNTLLKGNVRGVREDIEEEDNEAARQAFIKNCTDNATWKKMNAICEKRGYKLSNQSCVDVYSESKKIIDLRITQKDYDNRYLPEIYFYHGKYGSTNPIFKIQTTSFGALDMEEHTKYIEAITAAHEMIEEISKIDLYTLYNYSVVDKR